MIKNYIDNNLYAIESMVYNNDSAYTDALLVKRNKKMAMRMDSLTRERSMVFAVGAAHLVGDKGLVTLLREKGFMVEPVFSSKKIKPSDYKVAETETKWYDVKDDNNFYTALMPGKADNLTMYAILNMKMYFDVFKSTIYLTTAIQTPYSQAMADSVLGNIASYYFGTNSYPKGKPIVINNVPGREFLSTKNNYSQGYLLFKDGMMYIAIAMCMKKDTSAAMPIKKFLSSFTISTTTVNTENSYSYIDKSKAYKLVVPTEPKSANEIASRNEDSTIKSELYVPLILQQALIISLVQMK